MEWPKLNVKKFDFVRVTMPDEDRPRGYIVTDIIEHENGSYSMSAIGDPMNDA